MRACSMAFVGRCVRSHKYLYTAMKEHQESRTSSETCTNQLRGVNYGFRLTRDKSILYILQLMIWFGAPAKSENHARWQFPCASVSIPSIAVIFFTCYSLNMGSSVRTKVFRITVCHHQPLERM